MGKKLDFLMGKTFKTSKFKILAKLAISRIAILKNKRQVRSSHARSDVIELLKLGHQQRALLRVEHVIKEQNMLDVFLMIESYCRLLIDKVKIIKNKECPDELKESISSLLLAASRCGEFPELQGIRMLFESWFGIEFAARATELRNNCGVNPKIIEKFSAQQPSLESRMKMLKEIASENGITLHVEEDLYTIPAGVGEIAKNNHTIPSKESEKRNKKGGPERIVDASSLVLDRNILGERGMSPDKPGQIELLGKQTINDGRDDETMKGNGRWLHLDLISDRLTSNEYSKIKHFNEVADEDISDEDENDINYQSPKPLKSEADETTDSLNSVK